MAYAYKTLKRRMKGFTLVELLIVIVVIGILSAMMMLSAESAIASSKAIVIVNNLTNLKKAINFWVMENEDKIVWDSKAYLVKYKVKNTYQYSPVQEFWENRQGTNFRDTSGFKAEILRYMENPSIIGVSGVGGGGTYDVSAKGAAGLTTGAYRLNDDDPDDRKNRDVWYVGYVIGEGQNALKQALAGRAKSCNLLQQNRKNSRSYTDSDIVWMKVLDITTGIKK